MKYKRRNYVVDRRLQFGMISLFLSAVLIALFITTTGFIIYYWARYTSEEPETSEVIVVYTADAVLEENLTPEEGIQTSRMNIVLTPLLINNLCIMVIIAVLGVFFSHRIAGPLYRIQLVIDEVLEGNYERRVQLRPRDFGQELADKVNSLLDILRESKK